MSKILKNIAFICLMIVIHTGNSTCHAQYISGERPSWVYNTFAKWDVVNDTVCGEGDLWTFYVLDGFTVTLNGKEYTPLVSEPPMYHTAKKHIAASSVTEKSSFVLKSGENYSIGIRREGGKVYANYDEYRHYLDYMSTHNPPYNYLYSFGNPDYFPYRVTDDNEIILYDYTLQEGDVYAHVEGYEDIMVSAVGEIQLADGKHRRRLELSNGLVLIEGMGCINSVGLLLDYLNPSAERKGYFSYLEWYGEDDFEFTNDVKVKDTGVSGIAVSEAVFHKQNNILYDVQGRRINPTFNPQHSTFRKGIYIRDGKKFVK